MKIVLLGCYLSLPFLLVSQSVENYPIDSSEAAFSHWFDERVNRQSTPLYSGITYRLGKKATYGHPYFGTGQWQSGHVRLHDRWFTDVAIMYDIAEQKMIVRHPLATDSIKFATIGIMPQREFIQAFTLSDAYFRQSEQNGNLRYFHVLYDGQNFSVWVFYNKRKILEPSGSYFRETADHFLVINDRHYELKNKNDLKILGDDIKKQVRKLESEDSQFDLSEPVLLRNFMEKLDAYLE